MQVNVNALHLSNLKILQILLVLIVMLHLIFVFHAKIPKHVSDAKMALKDNYRMDNVYVKLAYILTLIKIASHVILMVA
jgi:hypothetical protein